MARRESKGKARIEVTKAIFTQRDLWEPDWSQGAGHLGGHIKDIPEPHVRRFPAPPGSKDWDGTPLLRDVRVQAVKYFQHWHIRIREEDNPVWDPNPNVAFNHPDEPIGWSEPWDDEGGKGRVFLNSSHGSSVEARKWIASIIRRHFPKTTHKIVNDANGLDEEYVESDAVKAGRRAIRREGD